MGASLPPATPEQQARAERLLSDLVRRTGLGRGPGRLSIDDVRMVKGQTTALIAVAIFREVESGRRRSIAVGADPAAEGWDRLGDAEVTALLARDAAAFLDGHHWQRLVGLGLRAAAALGALATVAAVLLGQATMVVPLLGFAVLIATQLVTAAMSRGLDLAADRHGVSITGDPAALARCYREQVAAAASGRRLGGPVAAALRRVSVSRAGAAQRLENIAAAAAADAA